MKHLFWFRHLLLTGTLLLAQYGALSHDLQHATKHLPAKPSTELCAQCLDFAQLGAGPLVSAAPTIGLAFHASSPVRLAMPAAVFSDSPSFDFHSRAPPIHFT